MKPAARGLQLIQPEHRAGLVVRVSTDMQARNPEGSLTTQLQRLRDHLAYKRDVAGELWEEVAVYELKAVSGKDSVRSPQFKRLFADIEAGRVNTVMFTALARLCRSVRDFLQLVEFLQAHDANFVSLKEDYDTTTAHGRLIMTIVMALAEFEREQTSERTRDATAARSERGLWNGGQILGFDLHPERKGYLLPNAGEAAIVNVAFDSYLTTGSIVETAAEMNRRGLRTKAYTSRREVLHGGRDFSYTSVQHLLKNPAYIGKKAIDARGQRRLVEAVWPAIVDTDTFDRVQRLLAVNARTNHSQAKQVRHVHILAAGIMECGRCGTAMVGRSGTGRLGKTYFYYACPSADCGFRVVAPEVEEAVVSRLGVLAADPATVDILVAKANAMLRKQKPVVEGRLRSLRRSAAALNAEAKNFARGLARATTESAAVLNANLADLGRRRDQLQSSVLEAERESADIDKASVTPDAIREGLLHFGRAFAHLRPYEQKELIRLVIKRAVIRDRELVLEVYGNAVESFAHAAGGMKTNPARAGFVEPPIWLPGEGSNLEPIG